MRSTVDGLSTEEAAEVCMRCLSSNLQLALQGGDPALHEVHVVQEHPATLLGVLVQGGLSGGLLALSHADECELAVLHCLSNLVGVLLNLLAGAVAGEQDEEEGGGGGGLLHHTAGTERLLVHVLAAHDLLTEVLQSIGDAVGAQCPDDEQLLELRDPAPLSRHWCTLCCLSHAPVVPVVTVLLHVLSQVGKGWQCGQHIQGSPLRLHHPAAEVIRDGWRGGVLHALAQGLVLRHVNGLTAEQDGEGQQRQHDELVAVKQAAAGVVVHRVGARVQQALQPLVQLLGAQLQVLLLLLLGHSIHH
mmetsp:Transcript_4404/g.9508  ORF Transcript_4404/g.9508 Transcript_4404/m.9508 type:complete len:303 (+) Transcript_4404:1934-2842(+)